MPTVCIVRGCKSVHWKGTKQHFHHLPADEELRGKWIEISGATKKRKSGRICSRHFESNAYKRNLKYELLGLPLPPSCKRFKPRAVPTLHLQNIEACMEPTSLIGASSHPKVLQQDGQDEATCRSSPLDGKACMEPTSLIGASSHPKVLQQDGQDEATCRSSPLDGKACMEPTSLIGASSHPKVLQQDGQDEATCSKNMFQFIVQMSAVVNNLKAELAAIYVFDDAPHLLMLVRNNLLDHGFTLDGNSKQTVTNSCVRELSLKVSMI
ncbi:hypothetical protein GWK47_022465 [Chionoecetes opilio]|uniref:THAP-type domain-containing protein n=1 Tax=Chionoecetes opilio TaxID=41210 RepID=A0A8J4XMT4_CHIOP|nr:hypothetical protein GWK47_022465 [Chionoecetes opilio]